MTITVQPWALQFSVTVEAPLVVETAFDAGTSTLTATVANPGPAAQAPGRVRFDANVDLSLAAGRVYFETMQSLEPPLLSTFDESGSTDLSPLAGTGVGVIELPSLPQPCLLIGALDFAGPPLGIALRSDTPGRLSALSLEFNLGATTIGPGERLSLPPVAFLDGRDPDELLTRYAASVAVTMQARARPESQTTVQFFAERDDPASVIAACAAAGYRPDVLCVVLEGADIARFEGIAGRIRSAGARPGASVDASVVDLPLLDQLRLAGLQYLELKGLPPSQAEARSLLQLVRRGLGDEPFLCAEGPLGAGIGPVDAMQTAAAPGVGTSLLRWWAAPWWCAHVGVVAGQSAAAEAEAVLAGGVLAVQSPPPAAISRLLLPTGHAATPVRGRSLPAWRATLEAGRSLFGVFNQGAATEWVGVFEYLQPGEIAFEPLAGRLLGRGDILLRPGEATLWQVSQPGVGPRVVGDSGSLCYSGLFERRVSGRVQVRNDAPAPRRIAVEVRGQVIELDLDPGEMRWFD